LVDERGPGEGAGAPAPGEEPRVAPSVRLFAPGTAIGRRYEVRGVLGTGGSAVVYEAYDRELKRRVALKVLRTDRTSEAALKRFRREVAVARDAAGPRLVRVFDIGQAGDTVFLTMELVEGESLRELLGRGPLPPEKAVEIGSEVLRALAALHALGIVHRDVKPGNILLSAAGEVKLADFGLARHWEGTETRVTETEGLVGTVEYLSPEQALGDLLDARSDLYSFGVVLFEMLAGKVPLRGDSAIGTIVAHIRQEPPEVRRLRPETPSWLGAVVARLLAKDRERRYATAGDVLADLAARKARRAPRRLKTSILLGGAAALALLLAALAFVPVFPWNRPRLTRLVSDGAGGALALDGDGRILWRRESAEPGKQVSLARLGGGASAVAVRGGPRDEKKALEFLDPFTGRIVAEMPIPEPSVLFPGFAKAYQAAALFPFDVEGDGVDELAVSLQQFPLYPSATFVFDLGQRRVIAGFFASGHHYPRAAVDVDGDGRKELVLVGYNNRMGLAGAVAALKVPPATETMHGGVELPSAESPDRASWSNAPSLLAWYALIPTAVLMGRSAVPAVQATGRGLRIGELGLRSVELGLDGFPLGPREPGESARRSLSRVEAYGHLREAQRLGGVGLPSRALEEAEMGLGRARAAGDAALAHWAERVRARALLDAGRPAEADLAWAGAAERAEEPAPIALEAGRAFHLKGELGRAVDWYRRGLSGRGERARVGGDPRDLALGLVLALGEAGRWDDAAAEVDRFEAALPDQVLYAKPLRAYVAWRTGRRPARFADQHDTVGLIRYWHLEVRRVLADDPARLLADAAGVAREAPEVSPLVDSLRAELLAALGRREEARAAAAEAVAECRAAAAADVDVRAHLALVEARARRLGVSPAEAAGPR
jgi:tRNA A-37 threonylcarbamoyl transferase component Bud32